MNKKGFTIVELVIVIAVIAILAGVMIPTFGGIIKTAQESGEMQRVTAAYKEAYALELADDGKIESGAVSEEVNGFTFTFTTVNAATGEVTACSVATASDTGYDYAFANGKWTATKSDS